MDIFIELARIMPSIIPAVVVVWFVLRLRESEKQEREVRDLQWQDFLRQQADGNLRALDAVATNLTELNRQFKEAAEKIARIELLMYDHDRHAESVAQSVAQMTPAAVRKRGSNAQKTSG